MTQEEKQLLLKDLCARLPYNVKCYPVITNGEPNTIGGYCEVLDDFYIREVGGWFPIYIIKPYLRPISSMTEKEYNEYENYVLNEKDELIKFCNSLNFYGRYHFDYRGLIEKGLALEAPKEMYNYG